jgi:cation:H+ antiporter
MWTYLAMIIGFAGVIKGADLLVSGASQLARRLHVSDLVIGLTVVSFGTSLPELSVGIFAAATGRTEIAVSNVLGSNIFNIFFILGISSVIRPLPFQYRDNADVGAAIVASILLGLCAFMGKRRVIDRWEGAVFLILCGGYILIRIGQG